MIGGSLWDDENISKEGLLDRIEQGLYSQYYRDENVFVALDDVAHLGMADSDLLHEKTLEGFLSNQILEVKDDVPLLTEEQKNIMHGYFVSDP